MGLFSNNVEQQRLIDLDNAGTWKPQQASTRTTQPAAVAQQPPSTGLLSSAAPTSMQDSMQRVQEVTQQAFTPPPAQALTGSKAPRVSSEMTSLLASDNPYIAQARARSQQHANRRGLLNSALGAQAGEEAAISAALPIASQDAGHLQNLNAMTHGTDESLRQSFGQEPLIRGRMAFGTDEAVRQATGLEPLTRGRMTHGTDEAIRQDSARTDEVIRGETARTEMQKELNVQQHNQVTGRMLTEQSLLLNRMDKQHRQGLESTVLGATNDVQKMMIAEMGAINRTEGLTPEQQKGAISDLEKRADANIKFIHSLASAAPSWDPLFAEIPSLEVSAPGATPGATPGSTSVTPEPYQDDGGEPYQVNAMQDDGGP